MRISDWSSDVCSSDLIVCEPCGEMIVRGTNFARARQKAEDVAGGFRQCTQRACCKVIAMRAAAGRRGAVADIDREHAPAAFYKRSSAERRVGQECVSTFRSRWSACHLKKKTST